MHPSHPLRRSLASSTPLESGTKNAIIDYLWPSNKSVQIDKLSNDDWAPYFDYYVNQCCHSLLGPPAVARTHGDIIKVAACLWQNMPREELETKLRSRINEVNTKTKNSNGMEETEESVNKTINLVARLYLMVNVGESQTTFLPGRTKLLWTNGPLHIFLLNHFEPSKSLNDISIRFEKTFTARNIERIAGITIHWTDNLADHLRILDAEDKSVAIFHHASFLKHHAVPIFPPLFPSPYPTGLVEETLRTLALLFPQNDRDIKVWLKSQSKRNSYAIDEQLLRCGYLRLDDRQKSNFHFWHDRLVILKQAYDESKPATLSQWWLDRRNRVQWYTFWVALAVLLLTVFFGIVQSIEGALQVYKAYNPTLT